MTTVISLGGSIVAPDRPDVPFLRDFSKRIRVYLAGGPERRLIFVVGGGGPAREWQGACRAVAASPTADALDWVGIMATRLNAQLVRAIFERECPHEVIMDPGAVTVFTGRILVAAGWKPGFSTDYDAVMLAERFQADTVVNLSNIAKVYTADPKKDPSAKPIDAIGWDGFRALVGDEWSPGANLPFDPIATKKAASLRLRVVCAAGRDLDNLDAILNGRPFTGTTIGPD
ncbi:MAG: UMP kinase [Spirochaetes bacterium]|nr:UMP kinase [Spirochaetota bacterium]